MPKKKKLMSAISFLLAFVLLIGSTLAYFTDRATTTSSGTAGSVKIDLIPDVILTDADGKDILNPGDGRQVNFKIQNVGNKSVDIQEIIKLTCTEPMTQTETQAEFELYKTSDVETLENGSVVPVSGAVPLAVRTVSDDKKTITYQVPDVVLDGNHATLLGNYEIEPEAEDKDYQEEEYTLVFRRDSSNMYQEQTVTIEKLVNAKQHRNSQEGWSLVTSETFTFHNTDKQGAVPVNPEEIDPATLRDRYSVSGNNGHFSAEYKKNVFAEDPININLTAENGYHFTDGSITCDDASAVITLGQDGKSATITIASASKNVTFNANPTADVAPVTTYSVSGNENEHMTATFAPSVNAGDPVTVQLSAGEGYKFNEGSVTCDDDSAVIEISADGKTATITIDSASQNVVFNATPTEIPAQTTYSVSGNVDEFTTANYPSSVNAGEPVTIQLSASEGHIYENGTITCNDDSAVIEISPDGKTATITIDSATQNVEFTAAAIDAPQPTSYSITWNEDEHTTADFTSPVAEGSSATIQLTADDGYHFDEGNVTCDDDSAVITISPNGKDVTISIANASQNVVFNAVPTEDAPPVTLHDTILYSDGTLVFQNQRPADPSHGEIVAEYPNINTVNGLAPWNDNLADIKAVEFLDEMTPTTPKNWFKSCVNLTSVSGVDKLNLSNTTDISRMFKGCTSLETLDLSNSPNNLDVSNIHDTTEMFAECTALKTLNLNGWNTTSFTDTKRMFQDCSALETLDLSNWDTSNVTDMEVMFHGCSSLQTLNESFNTSKVTNMKNMFFNCKALTSLNTAGFNTSAVTNMKNMFYGCNAITNLDVSGFNTEKVTDMASMFYNCYALDTIDVSNFDTQNVTDMESMFSGCHSVEELDVSDFNTANVEKMNSMFYDCESVKTLNVSGFDLSNTTSMEKMFSACFSLTDVIFDNGERHIDTSGITNMDGLFSRCTTLPEVDLTCFDTSSLTNAYQMFSNSPALKTIYASDKFVVDNITNDEYMFNTNNLLTGGAGTKYVYPNNGKEFAHIDEGTSNPGYFTDKNAVPVVEPEQDPTYTTSMIKGAAVPETEYATGIYGVRNKSVYGTSASYAHAFYNVEAGKQYLVSGNAASNPNQYPLIGFYDADGNLLSTAGETANTIYCDELVTAPEGAVTAVVNKSRGDAYISMVEAVEDVADYDLNAAAAKVQQKQSNPFTMPTTFDKGYVTFVVDDLIADVDSIASTFEEYNYPLTLAAPPSRLDARATALTSARGNYTPNMKMRDIMAQVVADGGEIMSHNFAPVVSAENQDDYDFMYGYFVKSKKELENAGFTVRGLMKAGGDGAISGTDQIEKWLINNYDYTNMGTAQNYTLDRNTINQDITYVKQLIDNAVSGKKWIRFMVHGYAFGGGNTFKNESDLREILDYCQSKGIQVTTYSHMIDTYGQHLN